MHTYTCAHVQTFGVAIVKHMSAVMRVLTEYSSASDGVLHSQSSLHTHSPPLCVVVLVRAGVARVTKELILQAWPRVPVHRYCTIGNHHQSCCGLLWPAV